MRHEWPNEDRPVPEPFARLMLIELGMQLALLAGGAFAVVHLFR